MANKSKPKAKSAIPPAPAGNSAVLGPVLETPAAFFLKRWPDQFAAPRSALILLGACLVLAVIIFGAAGLGGFAAVKMQLAGFFSLMRPETVSPGNYDMAMALLGVGSVVLLGLIHPCFGICLLVMARAWLDGYTFPADNIYFTWSIVILSVIWLARVVKGRDTMQVRAPVLLYGAFMLVLLLTVRQAGQYHIAYQLTWLWAGYGALFFLVGNLAQDRGIGGILLTCFLIALGMQAVFSIMHLEYLLPYMRRLIQNPVILQQYFNTTTITPELARRFMVNRAFGTMLFPNALAAYLLIGIPLVAVTGFPAWRQLRAYGKGGFPKVTVDSASDRATAAGMAGLAGVCAFITVYFFAHFPQSYRDTTDILPVYLETAFVTAAAIIGAVLAGLVLLYLYFKMGMKGLWLLLRFAGLAFLAPVLLYTLWITYSRGAFLALFAAALWSAFLYFYRPFLISFVRSRLQVRKESVRLWIVGGVALLFMGAAVFVAAHDSWAQPVESGSGVEAASGALSSPVRSGAPAPAAQMHQEGHAMTMSELADPASFRLRLGYWRVALRMAAANLLSGVGLGNFAVSYPVYQFIGAGDVREAHNGFLQMFSETGAAGGGIFLLFWLYFGVWGALRIVREKDAGEKLFLTGMYAGVVAFCLHAFLDINFSHPSLMLFIMVYLGLFYARVYGGDTEKERDAAPLKQGSFRGGAMAAVVMIVLLATVGAATMRPYLQQLALNRFSFINVADDAGLSRKMRMGQILIAEMDAYGQALLKNEESPQRPRMSVSQVSFFLDDLQRFSKTCGFYKPSPDQQRRYLRIGPEEAIPDNGIMVVAMEPYRVRNQAMAHINAWMKELIRLDALFPHSPDIALHIAKWHELHVHHIFGGVWEKFRRDWIENYLKWTRILTQRNPRHADLRLFHANALLWPVLYAQEFDSEALVRQALREFDEMLILSPISPGHRYAYASALEQLQAHYQAKGASDQAAQYAAKAAELRSEAEALQQRRNDAHLYH